MSKKDACHYCGSTDEDLRPYGPGGSFVCYPCATATPEREAQAHAAFDALFGAVEVVSPVVAIGTKEGPVPFDPGALDGLIGDDDE